MKYKFSKGEVVIYVGPSNPFHKYGNRLIIKKLNENARYPVQCYYQDSTEYEIYNFKYEHVRKLTKLDKALK